MIENRPYENGISKGKSFFIGTEVENTPYKGMNTLFVIGVQSIEDIQHEISQQNSYTDEARHIEHIYFGANMSFPYLEVNDAEGWKSWEDMIKFFLDKDYLCTLDLDISLSAGLAESGLQEYGNFHTMYSVKAPYIEQSGYNITFKIDDIGFNKTNRGVWCTPLHTLLDPKNFTGWHQYKKDKVIK